MRKLIVLFIAIALMLTVTACGEDPLYANSGTQQESVEETTAKVNVKDYPQTFDGLQDYLIKCELIDDDEDKKTDTLPEIIGAEKGIRYTLSSTAFIEFYEYDTNNVNEDAQKIIDQIKEDGTFSIGSLDPLTGVFSSSGKFLAVYNSKIDYDYQSIVDEFNKF